MQPLSVYAVEVIAALEGMADACAPMAAVQAPSASLVLVCLTAALAIVAAFLLGLRSRRAHKEPLRNVDAALLEQSHRAGMAEVASGVMHNAGNVLNNVTVATTLIREKLHKSEITDLNRVLDIVEQQQHRLPEFLANDPRGRQLPQYLLEAGRVLKTERFELLARVETLCKSVEHVADIIRVQKQHAKANGVQQQVFILDVVRDALEMSNMQLERHVISVETHDVAPDLCASLDRQRLLQILVNLISNAVQAIVRSGTDAGQIRIAAFRRDDQLHLMLTDNGAGIASENLPRIFHHAFTTRDEGQGLGLHDSALAAVAMGGELSAASDGPGKGATFLLTAPVGNCVN